jgi:HD-GYP domain-containing protein (c-di-GMP phosphodiesterase class II)
MNSISAENKYAKLAYEFENDTALKTEIAASSPKVQRYINNLCEKIGQLSKIGAALSAEHNLPILLQMILDEARRFTNADGGTLYMMSEDGKSLNFEIVQTGSLNIKMGGTSGNPINWYPVRLFLADGRPNHAMVSAHVGLTGEIVNIPDVYDVEGFDFTGTRAFDNKTGYRSKSMLVVPMRNHEDEIIGVLQILNAQDPLTGEVIPFSAADQSLIISLASQAAVAITNTRLIHDLENLFESFIQVIASAIDEKSPYTGGHIERVAELTMLIAQTINKVNYGKYADFSMNDDQLKELRIAAWMHDIGKITTPEYVVDKSTKMETIYDRLNTIQARFEILKRDIKIGLLEQHRSANGDSSAPAGSYLAEYAQNIKQLQDDFAFLRVANVGGEFMAPEKQARIREMGTRIFEIDGEKQPLLTAEEIENLCIPRGTLTEAERQIINNHVVVTIKMLEKLPYPKKLRRVPEFAGGHHEKLDGTGYPNHLTDEQLAVQTKIMALADIFEALTARDRPYKKGKTLSEAMKIMTFMARDKHIDPELFRIFVQEKIYLDYAQKFMDPGQIDEVTIDLATLK